MTVQKLIGVNYTTPDLIAKVTGRAKYAEDFRADGMLFCKLLLSPMPHARVSVRAQLPEAASASATIHVDLEIQFAGQTTHFKQIPFQLSTQGNQIRIAGTIPATLTDFKIDPPSLLAIPVKNEMPVRVDMTWRPQ